MAALVAALVAGCGTQPSQPTAAGHIMAENQPPRSGSIPAPVTQTIPVPAPRPAQKQETFSVSVVNVPVQELLFALARDAKLNIDINSGISGLVTVNAINQTLPQILSRISKQVDMRYQMDGTTIVVMPDTPILRNYVVDYVNMTRDTNGSVAIATQVATTGQGAVGGAGGGSNDNNSKTNLTNVAKNRFWETLVANIKDMLRETDKILPAQPARSDGETFRQMMDDTLAYRRRALEDTFQAARGEKSPNPKSSPASQPDSAAQGSVATYAPTPVYREAASVIANPETGVLTVRATARQHEKVQEFIDQVMNSARRQVLIEATVLEVQLSDNYQQGIDWSWIVNNGKLSLIQSTSGIPSQVGPTLFKGGVDFGSFKAAVKLMESFGTVKVLSSPKLSVINNQTALLKVVDNVVYFVTQAQTSQAQTTSLTTFTTTPNTVPVGFVMSVTPQISDTDTILLNIRPSISRIIGFVNDPNPALADAGVTSPFPQIQTREMESVVRINSGETAVMGGLMEDGIQNKDDLIPGAGRIPLLGQIFSSRNDTRTKSELVIFLRPVVIKNASLDGDYAAYRSLLPNDKFLDQPKFNNYFGDGASTIPLPNQ